MPNISRNFYCYRTDMSGDKYFVGEFVLYPNGEYDFNFNNINLVHNFKWTNIGKDEFKIYGVQANYKFLKTEDGFWKADIEGYAHYLSENHFKL